MFVAKLIFAGVGLSLVVAVILFIYGTIVGTNLKVAALATDKAATVAAAEGFWSTTTARLQHLKTLILAGIAFAAQAIEIAISQLDANVVAQLPWVQVFDAKVAALITIVCTMLIPITHAMGVAKAAVTPPVDPPPPATTAG